ncbi:hypothetical protein BJF83_06845 [Nocardiopsis sp. CNR-923]|nr:hypothetical protein BJF83_06845 [Nocardiopsis sp. CNR-923]
MSTGGRIALSAGGLLAFMTIVVLLIAIVNAVTGDDGTASAQQPDQTDQEPGRAVVETDAEGAAQPDAGETEGTGEGDGEGDIVLTATNAGTADDLLDGTVYTVVDVEIVNDSDESITVNPVYFTLILDDGLTVSAMDTYSADIDAFGMVTVRPGNRASGQLAAEGEVTIVQVEFSEAHGVMGGDPVVADVE